MGDSMIGRQVGYSREVLDHFENPRNVGVIKGADVDVTVSNPACGDTVRLTLIIRKGVITMARFKALGCVAAVASASRLTEVLTGLSLIQAAGLKDEAIAASLGGLPAEKVACSVLARQAVRSALAQHGRGIGPESD